WIEGWSRRKIARHYGKTEIAMQYYFQELKRRGFRVAGLSAKEISTIKRLNHGGRYLPTIG
ncbi:MAG: hypothetical protein ABL958_11420, partial [Bdellovibrionia bacterium]